MTTSDDIVTIQLTRGDVGQIIDGLEIRQESWQHTATHFPGDSCDAECPPFEECSDSEEAQNIADMYARIIRQLKAQL